MKTIMFCLVIFDDNLEMVTRIRYPEFALDRLATHIETCKEYGHIYSVYDWDVAIDYTVPFVMV